MSHKGSWSYGFIREKLKDGSYALVLAEVYFHRKRPYGCALVSWQELAQKSMMKLMVKDLIAQRRTGVFIRATDDGLKLGPRGRYSTKWLSQNKRVKKGAVFPQRSKGER